MSENEKKPSDGAVEKHDRHTGAVIPHGKGELQAPHGPENTPMDDAEHRLEEASQAVEEKRHEDENR